MFDFAKTVFSILARGKYHARVLIIFLTTALSVSCIGTYSTYDFSSEQPTTSSPSPAPNPSPSVPEPARLKTTVFATGQGQAFESTSYSMIIELNPVLAPNFTDPSAGDFSSTLPVWDGFLSN